MEHNPWERDRYCSTSHRSEGWTTRSLEAKGNPSRPGNTRTIQNRRNDIRFSI